MTASLRLLFNLESLAPPRTGIGRYTAELLSVLMASPEVAEVRGLLHGRLVHHEALQNQLNRNEGPGISVIPGLSPAGHAWLARQAPRIPGIYALKELYAHSIWRFRAAPLARQGWIYHEPNYILKPFQGPRLTTVHDLSHLAYPEFHPAERVAYLRRLLPRSLKQAHRILTVSAFVRQTLIEAFDLDPARISVTPNGVTAAYHPRSADATRPVLSKLGLRHGGYLLSVATLEPRKNLEGLINAYLELPPTVRAEYPLVLVGGAGWRDERLRQRLAETGASGDIRTTGYLPHDELLAVYSGAQAFAYPSFYEGFGLPVLEAMASGVAVVTSNRSALPEVAGDAALLVDPESITDLAEALCRVLTEPALRAELITRGQQRALGFSWEHSCAATLAAYRAAQNV